jgi:hypothetical protein
MDAVVGPVITRKGGYAFDCWTAQTGLSRGFPIAGSKTPITHAGSRSGLG